MSTMEKRVEELEEAVRRWRRMVIFFLLATGVALLASSARLEGHGEARTSLETHRIVVLNAAGDPVVVLTADQDGAGRLLLRGADGNEVASLGSGKEGGLFTLNNRVGQPVSALATNEEAGGLLFLYDQAGKVAFKAPPDKKK